jgi:prepilin signal peptidase PulO-like enzyme (type II secretory pathway)
MRENGLMNCLAGIGISYILFDFLAFYGLKVYEHYYFRDRAPEEGESFESHSSAYAAKDDREVDAITLTVTSGASGRLDEPNKGNLYSDPLLDETFNLKEDNEEGLDEDFEVMGGGDAVLAAVIAAWLGLAGLGFVLLLGFLIGTAMGASYLMIEMHKQRVLARSVGRISVYALGAFLLVEAFLWLIFYLTGLRQMGAAYFFQAEPWWQLGLAAISGGTILGIVSAGSKYSKPFPFGPALAFAALVAIFWNPFVTQGQGGA